MSHGNLQRLEAEAIHVLREVVATFSNPVMLYSIGKDSSVLLHLATKAFYPAKPPFPFLHVDTPRVHDLRHRFAVQTLINWHRAGEDVERELPVHSPPSLAMRMFAIPTGTCPPRRN
ncbi:universal stress like protein (plasmid) [Rhizobium sp. NXC14]|nr:universal stress like protein [Rhizobium sp. NXC14]